MKITALAALLAALSLPVAASAQVAQPQYPPNQVQAGHVSNPGKHAYRHWMRGISGIGLSSQQQQQVQSALTQYAAQHPAGSPRDRAGSHALRNQIYSFLNTTQQAQLQANMRAMHQQERQRRAMRMQQQPMQQQPMQPNQPQPVAPPAR